MIESANTDALSKFQEQIDAVKEINDNQSEMITRNQLKLLENQKQIDECYRILK